MIRLAIIEPISRNLDTTSTDCRNPTSLDNILLLRS